MERSFDSSELKGFRPGDWVEIISGPFGGMIGEVITAGEADALQGSMVAALSASVPGWLWFALDIGGERFPVSVPVDVVELVTDD
jgi:transcription antitermination factor NusG